MFSSLDLSAWLMLIVTYAHGVAAIAWLGGSVLHAFALQPLALAAPTQMRPAMSLIGPAYREIVDISIVTLIVSGLLLMFYRVQSDAATVAWVSVLAVKLALATGMFYIVWRQRRSKDDKQESRGLASRMLGYDALLAIGMVVFLLATLLRQLVEKAI